jgi:signal transduction histidine kinase
VIDVDFARRLAHEIEPSLVSLHLRLSSLEKEGACREEVRTCIAEVARLRSMMNDVLLLGRRPFEARVFPLAPIFEALAHRFRPIAASRRIALEMAPTTAMLAADPGATERALSSLLDNAVKFSTEQGRVAVWTREVDENVEVVVEDRGVGIPLPDQERIFDPFVRLDRETPGAGLGLSIARDQAEAQGGRLTLESEPGRGSKFVLTLRKA